MVVFFNEEDILSMVVMSMELCIDDGPGNNVAFNCAFSSLIF